MSGSIGPPGVAGRGGAMAGVGQHRGRRKRGETDRRGPHVNDRRER
jgi:hypothetical protein